MTGPLVSDPSGAYLAASPSSSPSQLPPSTPGQRHPHHQFHQSRSFAHCRIDRQNLTQLFTRGQRRRPGFGLTPDSLTAPGAGVLWGAPQNGEVLTGEMACPHRPQRRRPRPPTRVLAWVRQHPLITRLPRSSSAKTESSGPRFAALSQGVDDAPRRVWRGLICVIGQLRLAFAQADVHLLPVPPSAKPVAGIRPR